MPAVNVKLPTGAGPVSDGSEGGRIHVNFTDKELASEGRTFDPLPSGSYNVRITDIEEKECGPESKNPGKPFWHIEFTVQDGPYADRKVWTNAMLFSPALYTYVQLCKAIDRADLLQQGFIEDQETFNTREVSIVVKKQRDTYAEKRDGDGTAQWKNEVKSIMRPGSASSATAVAGAKKNALLP